MIEQFVSTNNNTAPFLRKKRVKDENRFETDEEAIERFIKHRGNFWQIKRTNKYSGLDAEGKSHADRLYWQK